MRRYRAWLKDDRQTWVVRDTRMDAYCALPDADGTLIPLEWRAELAAEAWLQKCYKKWFTWESQGKPVPEGWRPIDHPAPVTPLASQEREAWGKFLDHTQGCRPCSKAYLHCEDAGPLLARVKELRDQIGWG